MKKQIRTNVFETNSSSSHSISICKDPISKNFMDDITLDEYDNVVLKGGEFGWTPEDFYDASDKASYMAIYALDWSGENKEKHIDILKDVIKKQTGCEDVIFLFRTSEYDSDDKYQKDGFYAGEYLKWSYIDHQSVESRDYDYLFEDPEQLRQFIFNPNSYLHTDNDNY